MSTAPVGVVPITQRPAGHSSKSKKPLGLPWRSPSRMRSHHADSRCLAPSRGVTSDFVDPSHQAVPAEHLDSVALTALSDLLGGDDDALADLAGAFLAEAPERIAEIRTAVDQNDAGLAHRAGHTLKSKCPRVDPGGVSGSGTQPRVRRDRPPAPGRGRLSERAQLRRRPDSGS